MKRKQYGEVAEAVLLGSTSSTGSTRKRSTGNGGGFLPEAGTVTGSCQGGASAAEGAIQKAPKVAQGAKLRSSILSMRFHLKDLLGRGSLERVVAPSGPIIRLVAGRTGGEGVVGLARAPRN